MITLPSTKIPSKGSYLMAIAGQVFETTSMRIGFHDCSLRTKSLVPHSLSDRLLSLHRLTRGVW